MLWSSPQRMALPVTRMGSGPLWRFLVNWWPRPSTRRFPSTMISAFAKNSMWSDISIRSYIFGLMRCERLTSIHGRRGRWLAERLLVSLGLPATTQLTGTHPIPAIGMCPRQLCSSRQPQGYQEPLGQPAPAPPVDRRKPFAAHQAEDIGTDRYIAPHRVFCERRYHSARKAPG